MGNHSGSLASAKVMTFGGLRPQAHRSTPQQLVCTKWKAPAPGTAPSRGVYGDPGVARCGCKTPGVGASAHGEMAADGEPPLPSEMQAVPLRVLEVGRRPFSPQRRGEGGKNCCALPSCTWPYPKAAAWRCVRPDGPAESPDDPCGSLGSAMMSPPLHLRLARAGLSFRRSCLVGRPGVWLEAQPSDEVLQPRISMCASCLLHACGGISGPF